MTLFRPCIDLHEGRVKQIVGGTLSDDASDLDTNYVSDKPSSWFAELYKNDELAGGHVIMLGPGNEDAALKALAAYPIGLHIGGGITIDNAGRYLNEGASHVIITSWAFTGDELDIGKLDAIGRKIGRERLVIDLSCRRRDDTWFVAKDRWQTVTNFEITRENLEMLSGKCAEFLIHAADVEGKCGGIDEELVVKLGEWCNIPVTYAGGAKSLDDLSLVDSLSGGRVDLTIGSALDIFGGSLIKYSDCVKFNRGTL
ncbi:phosphoribosylformimino-5-aminoimidazole carboxamide ribotide isomerase [Candidatus Hydrogenedentota bacterium]